MELNRLGPDTSHRPFRTCTRRQRQSEVRVKQPFVDKISFAVTPFTSSSLAQEMLARGLYRKATAHPSEGEAKNEQSSGREQRDFEPRRALFPIPIPALLPE